MLRLFNIKQVVKLWLFSFAVAVMFSQTAEWSQDVLQHATKYLHPFEDPFVSSLRGACVPLGPDYSGMPVPVQNWNAETQLLTKGSFPAKVGLQVNDNGFAVRAPLVIYIPGSFTNLSYHQPKRWMWEYTRRGYHVVVVPNPWGTEFIGRGPTKPIGDVEHEAKTLYEGVRDIVDKIKDIGADGDQIRLAGVSSGGFLATIMMALDAEHEDPIFNLSATTYSAPVDMHASILEVDRLIDETDPEYGHISLPFLAHRYRKVCKLQDASELTEQHVKDSKGIVTFVAFHREIIQSVNVFDEISGLNKIPDRSWGMLSSDYRKWRRAFRFRNYFDDFAPGVRELLMSEKGKIMYWSDRAEAANGPGVLFLTTDDDFLNAPTAWPKGRNIVILKDGGHYGFRHLAWFSSFLDKAFTLNQGDKFKLLHDLSSHPQKPILSPRIREVPKVHTDEVVDILRDGLF